MAYLVACLSSGKGTWTLVNSLISKEKWDKVILITNDFGKENYKNPGAELIVLDLSQSVEVLKQNLLDKLSVLLKDQLGFSDVAVNMSSGTGKEHMALMSALLSLGVGVRLVDCIGDTCQEL